MMADTGETSPKNQSVTFFDAADRAELEQELARRAAQRFSTTALRAALFPEHQGAMERPDGCARAEGECGDLMSFYLRVENEHVQKITFTTDGCDATVASGETLAALATGLTVDQAEQVTPEALLDALDGLPDHHVHCAHLAVRTLHEAIADYRRRRGA